MGFPNNINILLVFSKICFPILSYPHLLDDNLPGMKNVHIEQDEKNVNQCSESHDSR